MNIKNKLKKISLFKYIKIILDTIKNKVGIFKRIGLLYVFFKDYFNYKRTEKNNNFLLRTEDLYPRIYDKTTTTPIDPIYFYQNCWCAKKIFDEKPDRHYDIGSQVQLVGIISQFTPTTMIDIRPLPVKLKGLSFVEGSILNLPFKNNEIKSYFFNSLF